MVSPEHLEIELRESFEQLQTSAVDLNRYEGSQLDWAFDIVTLDSYVAGLATRLLAGETVPFEDRPILFCEPYLVDNLWNGHWARNVDLTGIPEMLKCAQAIERTRAACVSYLRSK